MNSRFFWVEMANTYLKFGAHQDAIGAYTRALESLTHPVEQADLWCKIGDIHLTLKNLPEAVNAYHAASNLDPDGHDFAAILDRIPQRGQYDQSVINAVKQMLGLQVSAPVAAELEPAPAAVADLEPAPAAELEPALAAEAEPARAAVADLEPALAAESEPAPAAVVDLEPAPAAEAEPARAAVVDLEPAPAAEVEPASDVAAELEPAPAAEIVDHGLVDLPIEDVLPDPRPLRAAIEIAELVESVREHGIIQPLIVAPDETPGKYVVIAGNRRLEAARQAGLQTVPAIVRPASSQQRIEWSLVENTQRTDLNVLEQAQAFRSLSLHFGLDVLQIARQVSRPEAHVSRALNLLRLTGASRQALLNQSISEGHAHALLKIDVPEMQNSVLAFIIENNLNVHQVEDLVLRLVGHQTQAPEVPAAEVAEAAQPVAADAAPEAPAAEVAEAAQPVAADAAPEAPAAEVAEASQPVAEPVLVDDGGLTSTDEFTPITEAVADTSFPAASPEPAPDLALQTQAVVETDVLLAEPLPAAQVEQAWNAALDEMVIAPQSEPEAPYEPDVMVMPVHDENGVFDEARFKAYQGISLYERVTSDNPDNDRAWHTLGKYYSEVGQFDKAIQAINRAISIDATKDIYYYHLGQAYAASRRYLEAIHAFEQTVALNPQHVFAHCSLAGYYRKLGNDAEAIKHIEIALPNIRQEKAYNQACFEAICGNTERAIELLKTSLRVDQVPLEWLRSDPDLDFIREDPRFQQLLSEHEALLALKAH